jgi:hypothetical protein
MAGIGSFFGGFGSGLASGLSQEQQAQLQKLQMRMALQEFGQNQAARRALGGLGGMGSQNAPPATQAAPANQNVSAPRGGMMGGLEPGFAGNISNLMAAWAQGHPQHPLNIISGYRSPEKQASLHGYHAVPGMSAHQLGAAVDFGGMSPAELHQLGAMAPRYGVYWGGNWRRPDMPHFQAYPGFQQRGKWIDEHRQWLEDKGYHYAGA